MKKTQKELAFLHDLYVQTEWTPRFTDLVDKHIDLSEAENMLYINAGTGGHALSLDEKWGTKTDIFASCQNEDLLAIAQDKAAAVRSGIDFSCIRFEDAAFDAVLADASLIGASEVADFVEDVAGKARTDGDVAIFLPTAGSFGEIFSLLWEALVAADLGEHAHIAESLISELPTVSRLESMADEAGLVNVNTETAVEIFEFENSEAFTSSPLVMDFLIPAWLSELDENEKERAVKQLARLIDEENEDLTFRFSVKATLLSGEKA